jgi:hypothetical protein
MGKLLSFRPRNKSKSVEPLLEQASDSHIALHRLMAQARITYQGKLEAFEYNRAQLVEIETFINNASRYFEWVLDEQAELSIIGNLPIELVKDSRKILDERIKKYEESQLRKVYAVQTGDKGA